MPSGKKMYSTELKLEIVQRYLQGREAKNTLANEYHVNPSDITKWRDVYLEHGEAGLSTTHGTYTGDFKVFVVEYMHNTETSLSKTAAHFNIPDKSIIRKWERIYYELGKEALFVERRGRPMNIEKQNKEALIKENVEANKDLIAEIQRLRMENEYLKN